MRRVAAKTAGALVALLAIGAVTAYWYLRQSLPAFDGVTATPGISSPVEILRDADAIPHVYASTKRDALFGLGYVHAQDRLWQMELQRRIGHGRLAEIFGASALPQDRFLRTVGFGRAARAAWSAVGGRARGDVEAYVAGVNAFIAAHRGRLLPPEFTLLNFEPEPWDGADVIVWVKMLAWDLSANYAFELLRHDLIAAVGVDGMRELMPPSPPDGLSILSKSATVRGTKPSRVHGSEPGGPALHSPGGNATSVSFTAAPSWARAAADGLSHGVPVVRDFLTAGAVTESLGSNSWVVDGTLTASGRPLLANDPHLGAKIPSTWYLAHVTGGDFEIMGATLPGTPAVALGRNRFVAWGATNVAADVEDLYRERLDATGTVAEFRGDREPITRIDEEIKIKGSPPVHVRVRITRHGPLVSDAINANNAGRPDGQTRPPLEPLAFRWTALDPTDTTLESFLKLNESRNWQDFTSALRDFVVPSQNFVYADADGHIGYYAPGRIPIRASGDGGAPANGWTGEAEWIGWIPFEELPHTVDPPEHFIVSANNRPAPADYPHLIALEFPEPYRAQRIRDVLTSDSKHRFTTDDFARLQADTLSLHARALLPLLLPRAHPDTDGDRRALEIVGRWNMDARGDSAGAAIFQAWFLQLAPALVGRRLDAAVVENYQGRFSFVTRFVTNVLTARDSAWCDDANTPAPETCDQAVTKALHNAVDDLTQRLGTDAASWRWDGVHRAVFPHQGLDSAAGLGRFLRRSIPVGGDWSTIDVGAVSADRPYEQRSVASYRQIIDLSPANDSRFLDALGESGHPLSRHYDDFLQDWKAVRHRKMRTRREEIDAGATGRLVLIPLGSRE